MSAEGEIRQREVKTMPKDDGRREILTVRDVADYLNCHHSTIYRLVNSGQIPAFRLGSDWRFKRDVIDRWIEQENVRAETQRLNARTRGQTSKRQQ